ncbi:MAG: hypothetical protein GX320_06565 [Tissierellia bacterium]|nr:hypothetical protein [Tissierellia bacterium]
MNKTSTSNHLVINSKEEYILFQLGSTGEVTYTFFNQSNEPIKTLNLHKEGVIKYSVAIDDVDKIHLIALMRSGELSYSFYEGNNWSNAVIAKFDFPSKIYDNIQVLVEENSFNIIYSYANLINSKLWTIQHVTGSNENWNQYNVSRFVSDRRSNSFIVDKDSFNTIHLLYRSMEGDISQIYHMFFNSLTKKWITTPQKLTSSKTNKLFPYIFVDTRDNLHGLWLENVDNSHILKYSRLSSRDDKKYQWHQIKLPYISGCNNTPIMFEEKGILKIIYSKSNSIGCIYSLDNGNTWVEEDVLNIDSSKVNFIKISNLVFKSGSTKINDTYCSIDEQLNFYFLDNFNSSNIKYPSTKEKLVKPDKDINNIEGINTIIDHQKQIKDTLNKVLNSQNKTDEKVDQILEILKSRKGSFFDKFF